MKDKQLHFSPMLLRNVKMRPAQLDKLKGLVAQPKIDGVRLAICIKSFAEEPMFFSRSGQEISTVVKEALTDMMSDVKHYYLTNYQIYDCELVYDKDCAATTGILHAKHKELDPSKLELYIFDTIQLDGQDRPCCFSTLSFRMLQLDMISNVFHDSRIHVVPCWKHTGHDSSLQAAQKFADEHSLPFEGYVLKPENSQYLEGQRLPGSYKFKVSTEAKATVIAILPQTDSQGNCKHLAGTLVCKIGDASVNVTVAADNKVRKAIWDKAGQITKDKPTITVELFDCQSGKDNQFRMPRYVSGLEDY